MDCLVFQKIPSVFIFSGTEVKACVGSPYFLCCCADQPHVCWIKILRRENRFQYILSKQFKPISGSLGPVLARAAMLYLSVHKVWVERMCAWPLCGYFVCFFTILVSHLACHYPYLTFSLLGIVQPWCCFLVSTLLWCLAQTYFLLLLLHLCSQFFACITSLMHGWSDWGDFSRLLKWLFDQTQASWSNIILPALNKSGRRNVASPFDFDC